MNWKDIVKRNPRDSKKVRDAQQRKIDRESEREFIPKKPKPTKVKEPKPLPTKEEMVRIIEEDKKAREKYTGRTRRRRDVPFNPFGQNQAAERNRRRAEAEKERKRKERED